MYILNPERVSILPHHGLWPQIESDVFVADGACLIGEVTLGKGVSVWFNTVLRGDIHYIKIGDGCNIQDGSCLHVEAGLYPCVLENNVSIGHSVTLHGCHIEEDSLVGMGATILNNARVGKGSIVGAGALVPEGMNIPPNSLVIGVPGKVRRQVTEAELKRAKATAAKYRSYSVEYKNMSSLMTMDLFQNRFEAVKRP